MKLTLSGATITTPIVEVIDTLQNCDDIRSSYIKVIDELTRMIILDTSDFYDDEAFAMDRLHTLQQIRQDILTLSTKPAPSDSDDSATLTEE